MKFIYLFLTLLLPMAAAPLSEKQISARIDANESASLSEEALKVWQDSLVELEAADQALAGEEKARAELAKLSQLPKFTLPQLPAKDATLAEVEALLKEVQAEVKKIESASASIKNQSDESPARSTALTQNLERSQQALNELEIPVLEPGELEAARYQFELQKKRKLEAVLKQLRAERDLLAKKEERYSLRIRLRLDHLNELQDLEEKLSLRVVELREEEALETRAALVKSAQAFASVPELSTIVKEVQLLNEQRVGEGGLQERLREAGDYRESVQNMRTRIEEQFANAKRRIELLESAKLGLDDKTGLLLRRERARLPGTDQIASELRLNLERAAQAQISLLDLSDRISSLDGFGEKKIGGFLKANSDLQRGAIDDLLERRVKLLQTLKSEYGQLNVVLAEGTEAAKMTIAEIDEYSTYIDKRLLWIKSTEPLHLSEPLEEWGRLVDLFSPATLGQVLQSVQQNWFSKIIQISLMFILSLGILLRRRRLREILDKSCQEAVRRNCTRLLPTVETIGASVLLSLWFPLLLVLLSSLINDPASWRVGLLWLAGLLFVVKTLLSFARPQGLFVCHFKMKPDRAALIFRNLKWFLPFVAPTVFIVSALTNSEVSTQSGRFAFVLAMFLLFGICHHLFHPDRSILLKDGKSSSFTNLVYLILISIPIVFAIGASLGYFASVLTLRAQVAATAGLAILAYLVIRFLMRWTLVSRRGLAISQALRRRDAAIADREREAEGGDPQPELPSLDEVKAQAVDVVEVEEQTTQLLRLATYAAVFFGVWAIWASTAPALTVLDKVTLWGSDSATLAEPPAAPALPSFSGTVTEAKSKVKEIVQPAGDRVSLQNLLLSVAFLAITFISARNIPSLLSLTLFSRINLGPGGNFALTTTLRYLIVLIGVVLALQQIGITWGKVQWLAAAITLGIGFGLQEIFANFVAGIIMLFERPVRLGDVVTVGDISGRVTQIKIRATTIQQFNNRELIVPNKEFITSQLVNWTLKDSVLRVEVSVGIAYGSDTEKATRILEGILKDNPDVLDEPKPEILFVNFGNSTLDFTVRGFVGGVSQLISVKSDLHYAIDHAFREAGIEIAFPQQDIHLRSLPDGVSLTSQS